jgi:hypothetical protein
VIDLTARQVVICCGTGGVGKTTTAAAFAVEAARAGRRAVVVTIDPATVLPSTEQPTEPVNPISTFLAKFFDIDATTVQDYHNDGYGFGVIAQALWMSKSIIKDGTGDTTVVAKCILDAKKNGTYGDCFSFGDDPVPTNWGQFKKALMDNKEKHNLGVIVSGHADNGTEDVVTTNSLKEHGNGKDNGKGKGNGHGNGNGNKP